MDAVDTERARRSRRRSAGQLFRRLIVAIRDGDEHSVEQAVLQLAERRRIFAPLALIVGAFVMLFSALRLLVTNWRLMLVQTLPALLIWAVTLDLKAHVLHGKEFNIVRGPIVVVLFVLAVLVTIGAFFLNAAFAFTISQPGPPDLKAGFGGRASTPGRSSAGAPSLAWRWDSPRSWSRAGGCAGSRSRSASSWL